MRYSSAIRYVFLLILSLQLLLSPDFYPAVLGAPLSQTAGQNSDDDWSEPINLSQSGAASEPRMVSDADGILHVIWREDQSESFYYTFLDGDNWTQPVAVELPFATRRYSPDIEPEDPTPLYNPTLLADGIGRIHAFWIDEENALFYSSVPSGEIASFSSWSARQQLAGSVLGIAVAEDRDNRLHLGYIQKLDLPEAPAGIYYRQATPDDQLWSDAVVLYESDYYRSENPGSVKLQLETGAGLGDSTNIFTVMDNRSLEEVLYAYSEDRGQTWQVPAVVDRRRPEDALESLGPSRVGVIFSGEDLHLTWLAEHDAGCQLYHQVSDGTSFTWHSPTALIAIEDGCPTDYRLLRDEGSLLLLLTIWEDAAFLQAWNGEAWSEPYRQSGLVGFIDPETQRRIGLNCHQPVVDGDTLLVVGCGLVGAKQDTWLLERPLGDESQWFPQVEPPIWSDLELLESTPDHLSDPLILAGGDRLHTFWLATQPDNLATSNARIFYTYWDADNWWPRRVPLLHLDLAQADQLTGVYVPDNGPFLLWRDPQTNAHFFSVVKGEDILFPAEWSAPQVLFGPEALISHPAPYLDNNGDLNITYASPLNEGRGIFLTRTADNGKTWSDPIRIVDAAKNEWAMVDRPSLSQTANGDLHLLFTVYSLRPEPVAEAFYYTRSEDGGTTWSDPEPIAEGDIRWSQVVGIGDQMVLIAWHQQDSEEIRLWSQQSADGGITWERPLYILDSDTTPAVHILMTQLPDQPYLVQMQLDPDRGLRLLERSWREGAWGIAESHSLDPKLEIENLLNLAAAVTGDGRLTTIANTQIIPPLELEALQDGLAAAESPGEAPLDESGEALEDSPLYGLQFTQRTIELPAQSETKETALAGASTPVPPPTAAATLAPVMSPEPTPTATIAIAEFDKNQPAEGDQTTSPVQRSLLAFTPVILIILAVLVLGIVRSLPKY